MILFSVVLIILLNLSNELSISSTFCNGANTCSDEGFCNPNTFVCASYDPKMECGSWGDFITCNNVTNYGNGIVISRCGMLIKIYLNMYIIIIIYHKMY